MSPLCGIRYYFTKLRPYSPQTRALIITLPNCHFIFCFLFFSRLSPGQPNPPATNLIRGHRRLHHAPHGRSLFQGKYLLDHENLDNITNFFLNLNILSFLFKGFQFEALVVFALIMGLFDGCFITMLGPIAFDICGPAGASQVSKVDRRPIFKFNVEKLPKWPLMLNLNVSYAVSI